MTSPPPSWSGSRRHRTFNLLAFPADEIEDMQKDPVTTVTCEFCNTRYDFPAAELERLAQA